MPFLAVCYFLYCQSVITLRIQGDVDTPNHGLSSDTDEQMPVFSLNSFIKLILTFMQKKIILSFIRVAIKIAQWQFWQSMV